MENQHQKWVNLSYLAVAALLGYIVFSGSQQLVAVYDLEARVRQIDWIIRIGSILSGGLLFAILVRNEKANEFMNEVVLELLRVTWPTQKETSHATFLTIVMVLVAGLILGFLDYFWTKLIQWIV